MIQHVKCKLHKLPYKNHGISKTDPSFTESNLSIKGSKECFLGMLSIAKAPDSRFRRNIWNMRATRGLPISLSWDLWWRHCRSGGFFFSEIPGVFWGEAIWVLGLVKYVNLCWVQYRIVYLYYLVLQNSWKCNLWLVKEVYKASILYIMAVP